MAIAFVNRSENLVSASAFASVSTAAASHTTGNALIVGVSVQSANAVTVTDTASNTYTELVAITAGTNRLKLFYAYNITGNASNQVTATLASGTGGVFACAALQFSGLGTGEIAEWYASGTAATGTTISTSSSVRTRASEAVIVAMMEGGVTNPVSWTAGAGFTLDQFAGSTGTFFATQYRIVTAGQVVTATIPSSGWGIVAGSFSVYPSSGGGGGFTPMAIGAQTGIHHS